MFVESTRHSDCSKHPGKGWILQEAEKKGLNNVRVVRAPAQSEKVNQSLR